MNQTQYTEVQNTYTLWQAELGTQLVAVLRTMGVSEQTFYWLKKQDAEMGWVKIGA